MKKIITIMFLSITVLSGFSFADSGLTDAEKLQVGNVINGYLNKINSKLVATNLVKVKVSALETKLDALKTNPKFASNQRIQDLASYIGVSIDNWYSSGDSKMINLGYNLTSVAYSYNDFCKADKDGIVSCSKNTPPSDLGAVNKIVAGDNHFCAMRKRDNSIKCWGDNIKGQLDVPSDLTEATSLSAYGDYTCAVSKNKKLYCWGDDKNGLLKVNESLEGLNEVFVGKNNVCLGYNEEIKDKGTYVNVKCYGDDTYGQVTDFNKFVGDKNYYGINLGIGDGHICMNGYGDFVPGCFGYNKFGQALKLTNFLISSVLDENYTFEPYWGNWSISGDFGTYWNNDSLAQYLPSEDLTANVYAKGDMICLFKKYDKTEGDKTKDGQVFCIKK